MTDLATRISERDVEVLVLHGGLNRPGEAQVMAPPRAHRRTAAGRGAKGQYVGRIPRPFDDKHTVTVHDYRDASVPVFDRMHDKRRATYRTFGLTTVDEQQLQLSLDLPTG